MEAKEIAPCGINCAVCGRYRRKRNGCDGCRERAERKSVICSMKNCQNEARADASTCAGCGKLPCRRVRGFYERYLRVTAGYVSVVENLRRIEADGMDAFLRAEEKNGRAASAARACRCTRTAAQRAARRTGSRTRRSAKRNRRGKENAVRSCPHGVFSVKVTRRTGGCSSPAA